MPRQVVACLALSREHSQFQDPEVPLRPGCPSQSHPGFNLAWAVLSDMFWPKAEPHLTLVMGDPDPWPPTLPSHCVTSGNEIHLKSYLQLVVGKNNWPDVALCNCCTNDGRLKTQPASFPSSPLLTEAIFQDVKVPLQNMQNMEHRRGSWDGWWSTNCTSRKSLWLCYFYPAKDRIQPREGKELFFLWDFTISLFARNCCCARTIKDTDIMPFYLNL